MLGPVQALVDEIVRHDEAAVEVAAGRFEIVGEERARAGTNICDGRRVRRRALRGAERRELAPTCQRPPDDPIGSRSRSAPISRKARRRRRSSPGPEVAIWRDGSGAVHVWQDRCPHRGMRLSFGFVRGDELSCLYHGWRYGADGAVPLHPRASRPDAAEDDLRERLSLRRARRVGLDAAGRRGRGQAVALGDRGGPGPKPRHRCAVGRRLRHAGARGRRRGARAQRRVAAAFAGRAGRQG